MLHSISPPSSPPTNDVDLPDAPEAPPSSLPLANGSNGSASTDDSGSSEDSQSDTASGANDVSKVNLEAIFDDEDEDLTISAETTDRNSAAHGPSQTSPRYLDNPSDPSLLRAFYQRLFPHRPFFTWLNHSNTPKPTTKWTNREFAFTLANGSYLRYQSFPTVDLFRKQIVSLIPSRFEIGPVYTANPRDRKTLKRAAAFKPVEKELVFDIDMTDYDDVRTCCQKADVCGRCWGFMRMAMRVLEAALREDFGFRHVLWVFSGRRGIHAWVCDRRAMEMGDDLRKAMAGYLELLKGGDAMRKKVNLRRPLHPHVERSLRLLRDSFSAEVLQAQDPFAGTSGSEKLLSLLSTDPTLTTALSNKWTNSPSRTSSQKWSDIDALASDSSNTSSTFEPKKLLEAKQDIVLEYTYPRLDANVSKHLNHLLKSPFCVHPKTGMVCVPMDPGKSDEFDPSDAPTVAGLLGEIDSWNGGDPVKEAGKPVADWEKTSLKEHVEFFRNFVQGLAVDEGGATTAGVKRKVEDGGVPAVDEMEF